MNRKLLATALAAAVLVAGASGIYAASPNQAAGPQIVLASGQSVPDPRVQFQHAAELFQANQLDQLAQAVVPPSDWAAIRLAYDIARLQPVTDEDREGFAEVVVKVNDPAGVDELIQEITPRMEQARAQAPGAILMGAGALQFAIHDPDNELTQQQRESLAALIPGARDWAEHTDFFNPETLRTALEGVAVAAAAAGVKDLDQFKSLPIEELLRRAGPVLAAAKDGVRLYGLDLDAIAGTLEVETLEVDAAHAKVRTSVTAFGAPISIDHELVLKNGNWYLKEVMENVTVAAVFN